MISLSVFVVSWSKKECCAMRELSRPTDIPFLVKVAETNGIVEFVYFPTNRDDSIRLYHR